MKNKYMSTKKIKLLNKERLENIKKAIEEGLRVRCFPQHIKIELTQKIDTRKDKINLYLSSNTFNTIPVIHSEMSIIDFGGHVNKVTKEYISEDEVGEMKTIKEYEAIEFFIRVYVSYEGNCAEIFTLSGNFSTQEDYDNRIYDKKIN